MSNVQLTFDGDKELAKMFDQLPVTLQKKAMRKAAREAAKVVHQDALELVPKRTGALRASLKVRAAKFRSRKEGRTKVGSAVITSDGFFKGDQYYGGFLEFGTKPRYTQTGKYTGRIDEERWSYIRRALYRQPESVKARFREEMRRWMLEESAAAMAKYRAKLA